MNADDNREALETIRRDRELCVELGDEEQEETASNGAADNCVDSIASAEGVRDPFRLVPDGVEYAVEPKDGKTRWERVCSHLVVRAKTRNEEGKQWGRLLEVRDDDDRGHVWAMPMELLAGDGSEYRRELLSLGLRLAPGRKARERLHEYISTVEVTRRVLCVERIGWHGGVFVLPNATISAGACEVVHQSATALEHRFEVAGTLEDWRTNVGSLCVGNSRLVFAVSVACAAPLLRVSEYNGGGFHLFGRSSLGKTTALDVAGSFCGGGRDGYSHTWRATDNALEGVAEAHNDCLLCLDELKEVDPQRAGEIAYMLGNGSGKGRMARNTSLRCKKTWRLLYLSSGEQSLEETMAEGKRRMTAGQGVRLVNVPADAGAGFGLFESLHGLPSPDAFADELKRRARRYYGSPMSAYLERLVATDMAALKRLVAEHVEEFVSENCPTGADGQVSRVARLFGLVGAGGEIATEFDVLPWSDGVATSAAATCFRAWLDGRGTHGAAEVRDGMERLRAFLNANGSALFSDAANGGSGPEPRDRAGFRSTGEDGVEYWMFLERFRSVVGSSHREVAQALAERSHLATEDERLTARRTPSNEPRRRFYVVRASFLGENEQ